MRTDEARNAREMIERRRKAARELAIATRRLREVDNLHAEMLAKGEAVTAADVARTVDDGKSSVAAYLVLRHSVWASLSVSGAASRWKALREMIRAESEGAKA